MANISVPYVDHRRPLDLAVSGTESRKPTLRLLGYAIAAIIVAAMVFPFARDIYHRHQVIERLWPVLSEQERVAYRNWSGDAMSFNRAIYDRCLLTTGNEAACVRLRPSR